MPPRDDVTAQDTRPDRPAPRVSIGIPVYNGARFLAETLESHLTQTFTDFELIISDNGSTDATPAICEGFARRDRRVRYVRSDENRGAAWNFNRVFELAQGELFKWSAADDVCAREFLRRCVDGLDEDPEAVLAHPRWATIDEDGKVIHSFEAETPLGPWPRQPRQHVGRLMQSMFQSGLAAAATIHGVIRTDALRSVRPFGGYYASDFVVVTELATRGAFHQVPELLAFFRRHSASSSSYGHAGYARKMQQFFDPRSATRIREQVNLRRRYFEIARTIAGSPLPIRDRVALVVLECLLVGRRAARHAWPDAKDSPPAVTEPISGRHWSDVAAEASAHLPAHRP